MRFKLFLETPLYYTDIGHYQTKDERLNIQSYNYKCGDSNIQISRHGDNAFHARQFTVDFQGRIDHSKKNISISPQSWSGDECLQYLVRLLKTDFSGYTIYKFGNGEYPEKLA